MAAENKCSKCGQELPKFKVGDIVDVSSADRAGNYTGLAVIVDMSESSNRGTYPGLVFITGAQKGTKTAIIGASRLTVIHGYVHIDRPPLDTYVGPDDSINHKY